jgi:FAD-dependent urate hydroxylase
MRVLIAGAGIAGTVCAIALRKAGIEAEIFEAFAYGAEGVGAFLTLAVNGLDALRVVDIDPRSLGGFDTPRMALYLGNGRRLADFGYGTARADGLATRTTRRAELYVALRDEALRRGAGIAYGKRLSAARRLASGTVQAEFADGTVAHADVLVGADGLHSALRLILDPGAPRARYVGLLNTGGFARGARVTPGERGTFNMVFGRRCFFGYLVAPNDEIWWFANPGLAREPSPAELEAITPQMWRARLSELFADDNMPAGEIIGATEEIPRAWPTYDFPHVPTWQRDGMVIIGDAAHAASPSSGQGASMAIEDAVTLARCLRDARQVDTALAQYESLRRERVETVVRQGRRNGSGKTPGPLGRALRDLALRVIFARLDRANLDRQLGWQFDHHIVW